MKENERKTNKKSQEKMSRKTLTRLSFIILSILCNAEVSITFLFLELNPYLVTKPRKK